MVSRHRLHARALGSVRRPGQLATAPAWRVAFRATRWLFAILVLVGRLAWDRLRGRRGHAQLGLRLRMLFEAVGGTAVKLGQQLSIRVDLLPKPVCDQLVTLSDRVP